MAENKNENAQHRRAEEDESGGTGVPMLKNDQAMAAFEELLKFIKAADARSEAVFELMRTSGHASEHDLEGAMSGAKASSKAKWTSLRAKLEAILREENDI